MNKCRNCNVIVYDNTEVCPLCHSVLDEATKNEETAARKLVGAGAPYPDVRKREKRMQFVMKLILFLFILAEIGLVMINHFSMSKIWWSGISGVSMLYIYASMIYWIQHDSGYAAKIGLQITLTMLLLFGIDYYTGMSGWSLQWAIPGIILFGDGIVFFLMMLNRQHWYSYTLLLLFLGLCSGGIIALYVTHRITNMVLPVICASVTGVYLLATIIFGDREMARELKRRFHV